MRNNPVETAFRRTQAVDEATRRLRKPQAVDVEGVDWLCAQVAPGREFRVAQDLQAAGYRVFAPQGVRMERRRIAGLPGDARALVPANYFVFGAYLLVGRPAGFWLDRRAHRDLVGVVSDDSGPLRIPACVVGALVARWLAGEWDARVQAKAKPPFAPGETVRLTEGPFAGLDAVVDRLPSALRAAVWVTLLGAPRKITVDTVALAPL